MLISLKDGFRLAGVMLIVACAAFVCTLFLGYRADLQTLAGDITPGIMQVIYDAQLAASNVILAVTGGSLLATSIIVLLFYLSSRIMRQRRELGVLKALGYSDWELAVRFWVFGLSAFLGAAAGFAAALFWTPSFRAVMNKDELLPALPDTVHLELFGIIVLLPAVLLACIAVLGARHYLNKPPLTLIRGEESQKSFFAGGSSRPFLADLRRSVLRSRKALVFFIFFGGFCYGAMMQMGPSMRELSSEAMGLMMLVIGLVLAVTAVMLAAGSAVRARLRALALLHAVGYTGREQRAAVLGVYRPFAYIGFAVGTVYQYGLLRLMIDVFYADFPDLPEYSFDVPVFFIVLLTFVVFYEVCMNVCAAQVKKTPLRTFMME